MAELVDATDLKAVKVKTGPQPNGRFHKELRSKVFSEIELPRCCFKPG
jgi:hypothetical protein